MERKGVRSRWLVGAGLLLMLLVGQIADPTVNTPVDTERGTAGYSFGEDYAKPLPQIGSAYELVELTLDLGRSPGRGFVASSVLLLLIVAAASPAANVLRLDRDGGADRSVALRATPSRRGPPLAA